MTDQRAPLAIIDYLWEDCRLIISSSNKSIAQCACCCYGGHLQITATQARDGLEL